MYSIFREVLETLGVVWRNLMPRFASTPERKSCSSDNRTHNLCRLQYTLVPLRYELPLLCFIIFFYKKNYVYRIQKDGQTELIVDTDTLSRLSAQLFETLRVEWRNSTSGLVLLSEQGNENNSFLSSYIYHDFKLFSVRFLFLKGLYYFSLIPPCVLTFFL